MKAENLSKIPQVLDAALFGSSARGDADEHSDTDIFVLCEDLSYREIAHVKRAVADVLGIQELGVSMYPFTSALEMARSGSAFVWHLKLEGEIIYSRGQELEHLLNALKPYDGHMEDLELYASLLRDVEVSLAHTGKPNGFDLALLFTICRNTCMRMSFALGTPRFGRLSPFEVIASHFGRKLPLGKAEYEALLSWKLWYERGVSGPTDEPVQQEVRAIVTKVKKLIELGMEICQCTSC